MKRLLIIAGVAILGLVLVSWVALTVYVRELTDPDSLVAKIEASLNCRAEIKEASLNLWEKPVRMQVSGVGLGERDEFASPDIPLAERPELKAAVTIDTIFIEMDAMPLLNKQLVINNFVIERPSVKLRVYENGDTSLDELFRPPADPDQEASGSGGSGSGKPQRPKTFTADQLPVAALAERVAIEDATIYATIDKTKYTVQLDRAIVELINIDVDPNALEKRNAANLEFGINVSVDSLRHNQRFVELALDGNGSIQPFDPVTREFMPSLSASVTVLRDSYIVAMPMLDEIEEWIDKLDDFGASLEGVRLRGDFSEDTTLSFSASRDNITVTDDFMVPIDENFLIVENGSWVDPGQNDHQFKVSFIASERLTQKAEANADKYLKQLLGETEGVIVKKMIIDGLKEGPFLVLRFQSQGDFGQPEVSAKTPFGKDLGTLLDGSPDAAAQRMKDQLDGLLKSLLDKTGESSDPEDKEEPESAEPTEQNPVPSEAEAPSAGETSESAEEPESSGAEAVGEPIEPIEAIEATEPAAGPE